MYDLQGNLLKQTGETNADGTFKYDNLPGFRYVNITYDTYKYVRKTAKAAEVKVICGKDKGKKAEVIEILKSLNKAKVKGINMIKKHEKTTKEKKGGIITKENYIHISNLKSLDIKTQKEDKKNDTKIKRKV